MKKLSNIGVVLALLLLFLSGNAFTQSVDLHSESRTIFQKEQLSGIGTNQTIYMSKLQLTGKCKEKVESYLQSVPTVSSFDVQSDKIIIQWTELTTDNIIFFFEKLEFQYIFPYSSNQ